MWRPPSPSASSGLRRLQSKLDGCGMHRKRTIKERMQQLEIALQQRRKLWIPGRVEVHAEADDVVGVVVVNNDVGRRSDDIGRGDQRIEGSKADVEILEFRRHTSRKCPLDTGSGGPAG